MSSIFTGSISISLFGESHGKAIGVVIDNLPPGEELDMDRIRSFMARRAPRPSGPDPAAAASTSRKEPDEPNILSGVFDGRTTGTPLACIIENVGNHSGDYRDLKHTPRPGHADYSGSLRYKGYNDFRGGGHFSGRLTAPLTFAGAVAAQILERRGIFCGAHIYSIGGIKDKAWDFTDIKKEDLLALRGKKLAVINDAAGKKMMDAVKSAKADGDSLGGITECCVTGLPAGIGSPIFGGLENIISGLVFGIPAVKGLEFGAGFAVADMTGSECNDEMYYENTEQRTDMRNPAIKIQSRTNNNGGILGGISTGDPIIFRVAVKPTPSISKPQNTVNLRAMENTELSVTGRHDACIVPRVVPVIEAAANIAVLSALKSELAL
ncbi:MAG: chorismate synthase [Oscillospiraceae bacterium]|nr:chorismate synthase [Oscillospiraceae bacterium]